MLLFDLKFILYLKAFAFSIKAQIPQSNLNSHHSTDELQYCPCSCKFATSNRNIKVKKPVTPSYRMGSAKGLLGENTSWEIPERTESNGF